MWSNFHTHSRYCDGKGELNDYVVAAGNKLMSLGFSSHAPVPFECKWCMKEEDLPSYLTAIDALRREPGVPELYKSLEIDYIPGVLSPADFRDRLDYTIGSIHFIDRFPDGRPWEIDGQHTVFLSGLEQIFQNKVREAFVRYFELTREMIGRSRPDIVGHLDKMKIQNAGGKFFNEAESWYRDEVDRCLDLMADAGSILEVNTRGLYQKKSETPYPSPWILERALQKHIPVTLSSDAHHPDDLDNRFEETAALLYRTGYRKLSVFTEGRWKSLPFHSHGIVV